ncbi:MAG: 8-amino-7-oxononanoate synthase [Nitrospinota bacterium]
MKRIQERLNALESQGLYRKLNVFSGAHGTKMILEGREVLLFCTNDYLGLAADQRLKTAAIKAINDYGFGTGSSRLISGTLDLHEKLESKIAGFKKKEAAILFNSGYDTNCGTISTLVGKGDTIFCDRLNHASILDGARLSGAALKRFSHRDTVSLEKLLKKSSNASTRLVITDGVFSMDGDVAPLPELSRLAKKYDAFLMVDDAHATGVIGKEGRGTPEYFGLEGEVDIHMGTLSKAVGSIGGFVACSSEVKKFLINRSRNFIYTTSLPPAAIAASLEGVSIIEESPFLREKLLKNATFLRSCLCDAGFDTMTSELHIIPVLLGSDSVALKANQLLLQKGVFVPAIRHPTVPKGGARLRISLCAGHEKEDVEKVLKAVIETGKELGVI